jgi:two-component system, OmpR family, sensor kinase
MKSWWLRTPVRFRLAAWYAIGGTFLLAAFSAAIYFFVAHRMARPLDVNLRRDLAIIRSHLEINRDGSVLWDGKAMQSEETWPAKNPWFELWAENGSLVRRFWPFDESRLERLPVAPAPGRETLSVFNISPDVRLRTLALPLRLDGGVQTWMLRVITVHEPAASALTALFRIIAVALPVVVALLVLIGFTFTRRWLRPLDQMVVEANRITAHDLSRRLPVVNPHDELGRLAGVFNVTLARLEDSFSTLDRFVSDASHELLTPLTTLRSVGEVGLRAARAPEDYREIIGSMLEEAQRLQLLVEKLLQLARAEGGSNMLERTHVRIEELARQCAEDAAILAEEKEQHILTECAECVISTDALLLRQALQNLVDNAMKYSPRGATITIKVHETDTSCVLSVIDNGPGVQAEHRARLMDRFFRADDSRGKKRGGYGLGLAITKANMRVLGGELTYEPNLLGGSIFRLTLPKTVLVVSTQR